MAAVSARKFLPIVFFVTFILGYNLMTSATHVCSAAAAVPASTCNAGCQGGCECENNLAGCDPPGTASTLGTSMSETLHASLVAAAVTMEADFYLEKNAEVAYIFSKLDDMEKRMVAAWTEMWKVNKDYNISEAMQDLSAQLSVATAMQSFSKGTENDATNQIETQRKIKESGLDDQRAFRPSECGCVAATTSGGYGRSTAFSKAMRNAWENESVAIGYNKKGSPGATSIADSDKKRQEDYENMFCDPSGNGGRNECGNPADAKYYNADTQPTKFIYNQLTVNVADKDANGNPVMAKVVEMINNNMVGVPSAEPLSSGALKSATGQQIFLDRRSYLARYAAIRSVPDMIAGWRMPGSKVGAWVEQLRKDAGVDSSEISANPSYREVMHAVAVDRFNSGRYATKLIGDENSIEMEKLILNTFYLMQLRDYYELLERTALTLAVQVSILTDRAPMPSVVAAAPMGD